MYNFMFGIVDLLSFILIFLPLYPRPENDYIYSVNLFSYAETTFFNKMVYWILFVLLIIFGIIKTIVTKCELVKFQKMITSFSMITSVLTVSFLAIAKEPYATTLAFALFIIKVVFLMAHSKNT